MARFREKIMYKKTDKGSIVYVEDKRFGDNHYLILDKDGNCIDTIPQRAMPQGNLSDLLGKYNKERMKE